MLIDLIIFGIFWDFFSGQLLEDGVHHLGTLLISLSHLIQQVDQLEDSHLQYLEKIVGSIFWYFPSLFPTHRYIYYRGISQLFIALFCVGQVFESFLHRISEFDFDWF